MNLIISKNASVNYLAKIVEIKNFYPHPDPEVTRMKCASIDGFTICVGIDEPEGLYVYFPTSCEINPHLLSFANLYRKKYYNANPEEKAGFFEENGRVKAIKLRGQVSEGFLLPFTVFNRFIEDNLNLSLETPLPGLEFDTVENDGKEFWINKKYIPQSFNRIRDGNSKITRSTKKYSKIIEDQFRFHYDTIRVQKEPWCISPDDLIHISSKIHGTSGISAYVLCKRPPTFKEKIANLILGKRWNDDIIFYDYIYSSRSVIKNSEYNPNLSNGYYGCDVWAEADKAIRPLLKKGMTVYYEIVGYTPTNSYIQKNYDYGCRPLIDGETYTDEIHFKIRVYRITLTNVDGIVHEFSAREVQTWCINNGLIPVKELYYGYAKDLYPEISTDNIIEWQTEFWNKLANDKSFYMELNSPECYNKVPHEGIVIKKEDSKSRAWKLKTFAFLNNEGKELDKGEVNIEDIS